MFKTASLKKVRKHDFQQNNIEKYVKRKNHLQTQIKISSSAKDNSRKNNSIIIYNHP